MTSQVSVTYSSLKSSTLIELMFYSPLDTKLVISEMPFSANLLAIIAEKRKFYKREQNMSKLITLGNVCNCCIWQSLL